MPDAQLRRIPERSQPVLPANAPWLRIISLMATEPFPVTVPGIPADRIAALLLSTRRPTSLELALIADHYRVTVPWLVTGDDHAWDDEAACDG